VHAAIELLVTLELTADEKICRNHLYGDADVGLPGYGQFAGPASE
jgi:hypothetical protein